MGILINFRKAQSEDPEQIISGDDLIDLLDQQSASNWHGELGFDDLKYIAGYADQWGLYEVTIEDKWEWLANTEPVNNNPIVTLGQDAGWEVLDGKHRIGAARARGENTIKAWIPISEVT